MKLNNFKEYLVKRLDPQQIAEIEQQAEFEFESMRALQQDVSHAVAQYMTDKNVGFNELVRRLDISPSQLAKIQKGKTNMTLSSLAHLAALFNKRPHISFEDYRGTSL
jgi:transcriptional regulator with XRE-family HTH domain